MMNIYFLYKDYHITVLIIFVFLLIIYKINRVNILKYIFMSNDVNVMKIVCNNITYILNCINISYINYKYRISKFYIFHHIISYFTYEPYIVSLNNSKIIFDRYTKNKYIIKINYIFIHFKNIYLSQNGILKYKCIILNLRGGCKCKSGTNISVKKMTYKNVFSITQEWGFAVFHSIIECLTKIGNVIDELIADKNIFIHMYKSAAVNYLIFLGIEGRRIIFGNIYVKSLVITAKSKCGGYSNIYSLYKLRIKLREKSIIDKSIEILLIKRKRKRIFCNHDELYRKLLNEGYNTVVYDSNDSITKISHYFSSAKAIIAPHGAGLSNILFCKSDTLIIEILNRNNINLCYYGLAKSLGLIYVGIVSYIFNKKCLYVNISNLLNLLS